MRGLDNNDIFKHGASAKKAQPQKPYINTYINVSHFNAQTRQMENQGRFILAVQRTTTATNLTVYRSGAHNLFSFSLSRNIKWTLQNQVYVYITDPKGVQWLFQFQNANEAAQATAVIGILMSVKKSTESAIFDTNVVKASRGLQINDSATLTFYCFAISQFPFTTCPPTSTEIDYTIQIARDKLPVGFVTGILGMTIGSTRSIYVPSALTGLENGQRDNRFPAANMAIVVTLKSASFDTESSPQPQQSQIQSTASASEIQANMSQQSEVSDNSSSSPSKKQASAASSGIIIPPPDSQDDSQASPEVDSSEKNENPEPEDDIDPEEYERLQRIKKIQKMGGFSAFSVPSGPDNLGIGGKKKRTESGVKPTASFDSDTIFRKSQGRKVDNGDNEYIEYSGGLSETQRSIASKLDLLTGGSNDVMRGVSCLSIQLQQKIIEIDRMKQEMEEYRTKASSSVSFKELETVKREADQIKKENKILESKLNDLELRYKQLRQQSIDNAETSKQREKSIIKKLMGDAFTEISNIFEEESSYKGSEVSEQLYSILRKNAFSAMDDINKNGLF